QRFDDLVIPFPTGKKAARVTVVISPPNFSRNEEKENHANRYVGAVESRDQEKARAKLVRAPRVAPRPDAFQDQRGPFERLRPNEGGAKCRGHRQQGRG